IFAVGEKIRLSLRSRRETTTPRPSDPPRKPDHGDRAPPPAGRDRRHPRRAARRAQPVQRTQAARDHDRARPAAPRVRRPALRLLPGREARGRQPLGAPAGRAHLLQRLAGIGDGRPARHHRSSALRRRVSAPGEAPQTGTGTRRQVMTALFAAILLKGSILMIAAAAAVAVLSRASAATRHFIWTLTIVGLLLLPVFSTTLPRWELAVPIAPIETSAANDVARRAGITSAAPVTVSASATPRVSVIESPDTAWRLAWPLGLVTTLYVIGVLILLGRFVI